MTERVNRCYVRLPARPPSRIYEPAQLSGLSYATADGDGTVRETGRARMDEFPDARDTILIADARDVLLLTLPAPAVSGDRLRELLPGLIEDHLLVDPQRAHIAVLQRHQDGQLTLAVADRDWLTFVLEACDSKRRIRMLPAQLCVPVSNDRPTVIIEPTDPVSDTSVITVRTGLYSGYGIVLASAHATEWIQHRVGDAEILADDPLTAAWGNWIAGAASVADSDLCQFELSHARRSTSGQDAIRRWRWPASLGAVALLSCILGINLQWWILARQQSEIRNEMAQQIREHFPKVGPIVDAPLQMQQQLTALALLKGQPVAGDLDDLSSRLVAALGAIPPESVTELQYRRNTMQIRLAEDLKIDADTFRKRLEAAGIAAQQKDGRWHLELRS